MNNPEYIIFLVHGTFAPDAAWTKEDSFFRQKLLENLSPSSVEFKVHTWEGVLRRLNNSHRDRSSASRRLAFLVDKTINEFPDSKIVIIGHSHGGNVALNSIKHSSYSHKIKVVTLSTPFIKVSMKKLTIIDNCFTGILFIILSPINVYIFIGLFAIDIALRIDKFLSYRFPGNERWILEAIFGLLMFIISIFLGRKIASLIDAISDEEGIQQYINTEYKSPELTNESVYCCATAFDEASFALVLSGIISNLPIIILNKIFTAALFIFLASRIYTYINLYIQSPDTSMTFLINAGSLLLFLPTFTLLYLIASSIISFIFNFISLGILDVRLSTFCDIEIRKTPIGIEKWHGFAPTGPGLVHSRLYDYLPVIKSISEWIKASN